MRPFARNFKDVTSTPPLEYNRVSIDLTVRGSKLDAVSRQQEKSTNSETKRSSYSEGQFFKHEA